MDNCPTNAKPVKSNRLSINYKFTKKYNMICTDNNDRSQEKSNGEKNSLNLFQGIVKLGTIKSFKANNIPFDKCRSINNSHNIFEFTDSLYNDEEHFYKNQIYSCKNSENELPRNIYKKGSGGLLGFSLKRKTKKISILKYKSGEVNKNKSNKNFSFFFKLKEKDKIPSKTPYLDKNHWNSSFNIKKLEFNNKVGGTLPFKKKNSSNVSLVHQSLFSKEKVDDNKGDNITMFHGKNDSIKKSLNTDNEDKKKSENKKIKGNINGTIIYRKEDKKENNSFNDDNKNNNNNIVNIVTKKEIIKIDNNNNDNQNNEIEKENKNSIPKKNNKKSSNNIVFNILNKPFFCCFKS